MASTDGPLEGASAHHHRPGTLEGRSERWRASRPSLQCPSDCTGCEPTTGSGDAAPVASRPFQGTGLVVASFCYFLLPLAAALIGALLAGQGAVQQLLGAGAGLLAATAVAVSIAGLLRHRWPEDT